MIKLGFQKWMKNESSKQIKNQSNQDQKWIENGSKMDRKWIENGSKMNPNIRSRDGLKHSRLNQWLVNR